MFRKIQEARENEEGFTLIELLVVVIIIGILAAIAIPAFLSVRGNAGDATVQSDLRNAVIHMESYYTSNGDYAATESDITDAGWEISSETQDDSAATPTDGTVDFNAAADAFCISATHAESDTVYAVTADDNEPIPFASGCGGSAATDITP